MYVHDPAGNLTQLTKDTVTLSFPVDPADPAKPQSWNMYAYARNNPVLNVDPDGRSARSALRYLYETVSGRLKDITRAQAVRASARGEVHRVTVQGGEGAVREARSIVKDAFPGQKIVHHESHIEGGLPHFQPKGKGLDGQVGYDIAKTLVGLIPIIGAAADAEAANGSDETGYGARFAARSEALYGAKPLTDLTLDERREIVRSLEDEKRRREQVTQPEPRQ